jgi:hypothetical protein
LQQTAELIDVKATEAGAAGRPSVTFHTVLDRRQAGAAEPRHRRSANWKNIFSLHRASQADLSLHQREVNIDEAVLLPLSHTRPRPKSELNLAYSVQVQETEESSLYNG